MECCCAQLLATDRAVLSRAATVFPNSLPPKKASSTIVALPKWKTVLMTMIAAPSETGAVTDRWRWCWRSWPRIPQTSPPRWQNRPRACLQDQPALQEAAPETMEWLNFSSCGRKTPVPLLIIVGIAYLKQKYRIPVFNRQRYKKAFLIAAWGVLFYNGFQEG